MHKLNQAAQDPGRTLTADLCDKYENAEVLKGPFFSYGRRHACVGAVEVISTQNDNSLVAEALREPGDDRILIVDNSALTDCALVGGNLAEAAHSNGWQGIIVNGAIRDVVELREVPIAIFALASCPRKSLKQGLGVRGKPIEFAGTLVARDDIAAADPDGVIIISAAAFDGA